MRLVEDQVAVVTGAASGIGYALAEAFGARGLSVVMADVEERALEDAAGVVEAKGVPVLAVPTDVTDADQVEVLARRTLDHFERVDVVCSNAGVDSNTAPAWEMDLLDWHWVIGVNLWGVIHGIRSFLPHLVAQGHGHLVNTASMAGILPLPFLAPYAAAKRAIVAISETLRIELDDRAPDVGVTVVCPSYVHTRIGSSARNRPASLTPPGEQTQDGLLAHLGRMEEIAMEPPEVAAKVLEAIEANVLHLATHDDVYDRVREWCDQLLADIAHRP